MHPLEGERILLACVSGSSFLLYERFSVRWI